MQRNRERKRESDKSDDGDADGDGNEEKDTQNVIYYSRAFLASIRQAQRTGRYSPEFVQIEWPKLRQAAEVHGYRGPSKKKHNGIAPLRPTDTELHNALLRFTPLSMITTGRLQGAIPVKIVAHVPSGNRLVGYRLKDGTFHILGLANYSGECE